MFTRFFIDRPIFASVLSIVITLAGGLALVSLPIAMFPQIAPPTVSVTCQYPGASAQVVAETIAAPIEQQVNGVENMMYMSSACTNDGNYTLTVTFKHGVDLNLAQVLVQNRVSLAVPLLPDVIKATGVTTKKRSPDILLSIGIYSPDAPVRPALPEQLRLHADPRRAGAAARRQRRDHVRPARLQHADLARPRQARAAEPDRRRRRAGPPRAEPPGGHRPGRPVADPPRAANPGHPDHARPARRRRPVREDHHPDHSPTAGWCGSATSAAWSSAPRTRT